MAERCGRGSDPILLGERCNGCGLCAAACPCGAVRLDAGGRPRFACSIRCTGDANCIACRGGFYPCQAVCEADAIQVSFVIRQQPA